MKLPSWGGKRRGAGRKPRRGRRLVAHRARRVFNHRRPLHVTMRIADGVFSLRARRSRCAVERMLAGGATFGVSVVQLSVQGNHVHLLVEAPDHIALSRALKGMAVRLARGDRYHAHVLATPTEVRHAIHYIRHNYRKHEAQCGRVLPSRYVDPCSSDGELAGYVVKASVWLLKAGLRGPPPNAL